MHQFEIKSKRLFQKLQTEVIVLRHPGIYPIGIYLFWHLGLKILDSESVQPGQAPWVVHQQMSQSLRVLIGHSRQDWFLHRFYDN